MARQAFIDANLCDGRADCQAMSACPTKSFLREEESEPWFIGPTCLGCGRCVMACDRQAIRLI
ncbi:MAG: hypothetical protein PWR22_244 [Moorella sp. (in: firmicutes)]|jgi:TPP-dependent indolepyruvate ferredoxin oxidoreductase alpha subunit|uniref:hypothetical protein n=1 Tax=unclassified Neomoorella TaxID=2676739 RepID=UPI0010FFAB75|nr:MULTISPECIES: hypothetical protein [unclassified Moorella (in: firmicutes)]MDK2815616.1 hypothetical protein [Moorella sp. (in: firmicutes)]MDK2894198.1 hypothetical protein [Moorella sp. (in: firmicutes)]GEA15111.1 hypothetical protein E308F_13550 [Moorella sp. E308F]GEA16978.1 hypothetical protein E306M_01120 [Moorella sp. E306M]